MAASGKVSKLIGSGGRRTIHECEIPNGTALIDTSVAVRVFKVPYAPIGIPEYVTAAFDLHFYYLCTDFVYSMIMRKQQVCNKNNRKKLKIQMMMHI